MLSRALGLELVDADGLIEAQQMQTLQQIMDTRGNVVFRAIEEQVLTQMPLFPSVISTGGSVIYSEKSWRAFRHTRPWFIFGRASKPLNTVYPWHPIGVSHRTASKPCVIYMRSACRFMSATETS